MSNTVSVAVNPRTSRRRGTPHRILHKYERPLQLQHSYDPSYAIQVDLRAERLLLDLLDAINDRYHYNDPPELRDKDSHRIALENLQDVKHWSRSRFEWEGDQIANDLVYDLILTTMNRHVRAGKCSAKEARAGLSRALSSMSFLRSNAVYALLSFKLGMTNEFSNKEGGDIFEAYVYALSIDYHKDWLPLFMEELFQPLVDLVIREYVLEEAFRRHGTSW